MEFDFDELERRAGGRFQLVLAIAERARKLQQGAPPLVDPEVVGSHNYLTIAMAELALGRIKVVAPADAL